MLKQGAPPSQTKKFSHSRMSDRDRSNQLANPTNTGPQFQTSRGAGPTSVGLMLDLLTSPLCCTSPPFNSTAKQSGWTRPQSPYTSPTGRIYCERHCPDRVLLMYSLEQLHCLKKGTPEVHEKMHPRKWIPFQLVRLVGAVGIEPTTFGLKGRCSTTELRP